MVALLRNLLGLRTRKTLADEVKDYITVKQSLINIEIPKEQIDNINSLLRLEKNYLEENTLNFKDFSTNRVKYKLINWYDKIEDKRLYETFVNGENDCSQNYTGTKFFVNKVREENPSSVILVHGMGLELNFYLIDKLLSEPNLPYGYR